MTSWLHHVAVNRELIQLYLDINRLIVVRQEEAGWGKGIVDRLAADIQRAYLSLQGFSPRNIWRMRAFYLAYTKGVAVLPQAVAEISWGHNAWLSEKVKDPAHRLWYAAKTIEHGWSRTILTVQIESGLYGRQGKATTNFSATLPNPQSELHTQRRATPYIARQAPYTTPLCC